MSISKAATITLTLMLWVVIFFVVMPRACTKEFQNQDAMNAKYALTGMQFSGSSNMSPYNKETL